LTLQIPPPTARLEFRLWSPDDLERALGLWGDPRVTARIDARPQLTLVDVQARLDREIACLREHGVQYWPIFLRATGEHVGCCGLRPYDPARRVFELGFHIRADHWRRGYAGEAARGVIAFAFAGLASALFAGHHPDNAASRDLLVRLGFRHTHDEGFPPTGLMHPSYLLTPADVTA
jgi:[ribosomal protein S5]-alanine N-acetyltransferase